MENHPIPQDVTGFKFKLIGSITVKQFLYLLGFGILTTVCFITPMSPFLRVPLMMLFSFIGIALAFFPIEGRPMDTMLVNFAKTIPSENRYIYRKKGANLSTFEMFKTTPKLSVKAAAATPQATKTSNDDQRAALLSRLRNSSLKPDEEELTHLKSIRSFFDETEGVNKRVTAPIPADAPQPIATKEVEIKEEPAAQPLPEPKEDLAEKVMKDIQSSLDKEQVISPSKGEGETPTSARHVEPDSTLKAGFPSLPDVGNVVMGIIRDPRGKTLPNILVEIVDTNNIPVRAFKTNALGQFASATPLANGTYKVYFEDAQKQHEFEIVQIELNGSIFNPIEVTSVDSREKLRRELFGGQPAATA